MPIEHRNITIKVLKEKDPSKKKPYRVRAAGFEDKMFADLQSAITFAKMRAQEIFNSVRVLSAEEMDELRFKARQWSEFEQQLAPFGWSADKARISIVEQLNNMGPENVHTFTELYGPRLAKVKETTVSSALASYKAHLLTCAATKKHRINQETTFAAFEIEYGAEPIHLIGCADLDRFLLEHTNGTNSHDKWRYALRGLFTFARDYLKALPQETVLEIDRIVRRKVDKAPTEVMPLKDVVHLGRVLPDKTTLLAYSLALFGFLRTSEIEELNVETFQRDKEGKLYQLNLLGKHKPGQTHLRRVIPLKPNLARILEALIPDSGALFIDKKVFARIRAIARAQKVRMPHNVLRHSGASYALASGDKDLEIAEWNGDTKEVLYKNYIAAVSHEDAKKYWQITFNIERISKLPRFKKADCELKARHANPGELITPEFNLDDRKAA
jgi:integrase